MKLVINKQSILEEVSKSKYFDNISCAGIKEKLGFSCGQEKKNKKVFIYTHRARSPGYDSLEKIPMKHIKFIDSTG